jgi:hypothetical protein
VKKGKLTSFHYEQILLNESPLIGDEIGTDEQEILEEMKNSNYRILKKYPPEMMGESIKNRIDRQSAEVKGNFKIKKVYIPLSAAAVLLLFFSIFPIYRQSNSVRTGDMTETIRLKGNNPSLYIYRGNSHDAELLTNNSLVKEKDLLQISYNSAGLKYGVIFSIDGRGTVTLHYPDNVYSNTRLDYGGKVYLPYSYELDNAPFFERFFFITSDDEIDVSAIMENAGRIAQGNKSEMLTLPVNLFQQAIILFKEETE